VIAAMWMRESPSGEARTGPEAPVTDTPGPAGALPALAGGSPELDLERAPGEGAEGPEEGSIAPLRQPEVVFVAVVAGAATIFFGIVPQPLFELVHGAGAALGLT
jgi:hypothetical protein